MLSKQIRSAIKKPSVASSWCFVWFAEQTATIYIGLTDWFL